MKILEVIPSLGSGGGEKFVIDLSNSFAKQGHECTILTLYDSLDSDILRPYIQSDVCVASIGKKSGLDVKCLVNFCKYVYEHKPDVVHVHLGAILYVSLAAILYRKVKYFATLHSEARREAGTGISKFMRQILFKLRLVVPVTISPESEKSFENFYKKPAIMITNGCAGYDVNETNRFKQYRYNVDYLFFHAGRIHSVKNQIMLVKVFKEILDCGVNGRLLIAGRVEDTSVYSQIEPYLSDRILYIGEQPDVRAIMSVSDAFCLSSMMEGMPITIIEAMSVGCVPIVTPVGGCRDMIVDGQNGFISTDVSESSYREAFQRFLLSTRELKNHIKENCLQDYNEKYSINRTSSEYINLFSTAK